MEYLSVPRVLIGGLSSGAGKSFVALGLALELRKRNVSVSCAVTGPRMAQAAILKRISGRVVRTLEQRLLDPAQMEQALFHAGIGADVVLIDGQRGFFDGRSTQDVEGSDASVAAMCAVPAILVLDCRGFEASIVALLEGSRHIAHALFPPSSAGVPAISLGGVVLNRSLAPDMQGESAREYFSSAFSSYRLGGFLGVVPELATAGDLPRGNFLQDRNQTSLARQFLVELCDIVAKNIDCEGILEIARTAPHLEIPDFTHEPSARRCRIAVSDDSCFALTFQDNRDLFRYFGAEVVTFSPLADSAVPRRVGALYFSGAFLGEYGEELSRNEEMKRSILDFAASGGIVIAEGAGAAYLCQEYQVEAQGAVVPGVGLIPAVAMRDAVRPRYIEAVTTEESVWGRPGLVCRGYETGEWRLAREDRMLRVLRRAELGRQPEPDGFSPGAQVMCSFSFFHFGSNPLIAKNIVDAAEVVSGLGG